MDRENVDYYSILGSDREDGNKMETTLVCWGCIRIMEKKMETATEDNGHGIRVLENSY